MLFQADEASVAEMGRESSSSSSSSSGSSSGSGYSSSSGSSSGAVVGGEGVAKGSDPSIPSQGIDQWRRL